MNQSLLVDFYTTLVKGENCIVNAPDHPLIKSESIQTCPEFPCISP